MNYLEEKNNLDNAQKELEEKLAEFSVLDIEIAKTAERIADLKAKIENAPSLIATGKSSTEEFLALRRELQDYESTATALNDAKKIQQLALVPFNDALKMAKRREANARNAMLEALPRMTARRIIDHSPEVTELLQDLVNASVAASGIMGPGIDESLVYQWIGMSLAKQLDKRLPDFVTAQRISIGCGIALLTGEA